MLGRILVHPNGRSSPAEHFVVYFFDKLVVRIVAKCVVDVLEFTNKLRVAETSVSLDILKVEQEHENLVEKIGKYNVTVLVNVQFHDFLEGIIEFGTFFVTDPRNHVRLVVVLQEIPFQP